MNLPRDLFFEVLKFLKFSDIGILKTVSKTIPELRFKFKTIPNYIIYTDNLNNKIVQTSYLLTNNLIKNDQPTQIKNNFVDIKLYNGKIIYHFTIFKDIYQPKKDILDYLKNSKDKSIVKKIYYNEKSHSLGIIIPKNSVV